MALILDALGRYVNIQVSISVKMSTILLTLFFIGIVTVGLVRYRVTTKYSRLSTELDKDDDEDQAIAAEMWLEPSDSDIDMLSSEKSPVSSHFDEFLKAIKVFGFLDHEVFTELTKSTQTLRIQSGESVKLAEIGGFAVVISGSMKVYCQSDAATTTGSGSGSTTPGLPGSGYDLLNEIGVASPISSLSSILSLFSDGMESDSKCSEFDRVNSSTVAIASEDSTIIIIPAQAFHNLTRKYPHAAANIVQIILFRWSQVTFRTCQRYLNLTQQFYGTERSLNATAKSRIDRHLPKWLVDDAVRQLKRRAAESAPDEKVVELKLSRKQGAGAAKRTQDVAVDSAAAKAAVVNSLSRRSSLQFLAQDVVSRRGSAASNTAGGPTGSHNVDIDDGTNRRSSEFPGDLLSHASLSFHRQTGSATSNGSGANSQNAQGANGDMPPSFWSSRYDSEETALRRAIVETMFSTIMFDSKINGNTSSAEETKKPVKPKQARETAVNDPLFKSDLESFERSNACVDNMLDESSMETNFRQQLKQAQDQKSGRPRSRSTTTSTTATEDEEAPECPVPLTASPAVPPVLSYNEILEDASEMVELLWYRKGEYLSRYGERCRGLIYVLDGSLEVGHHPTSPVLDRSNNNNNCRNTSSTASNGNGRYERLYDVESGNLTGFLETISSYSSFVDLIARRDTCVAVISKNYFERLAEVYPLLYISAAKALTTSLTRPMVQLDFALEWISIKSGGRLLREGSTANAIYFVLNGRMRAYHQQRLIAEYGHGSTIGELETMSGEPYAATVIAARDTELSRFPRTLVECLARQYPSVTFEMARMIVSAMRARNSLAPTLDMDSTTNENTTGNGGGVNANVFTDFKTLAILPTSTSIPVEDFALKLSSAFQTIGREVKVLTNSVILRYLGKYAFHKLGALKLRAYLADLEDRFDVLLYVAEGLSTSQWSRTCVDQADCVLLLADGESKPVFSDVERMVVRSPTRSRAHLVLLHNEKQVRHGSTAKWLKHRPWISAHHHILMPFTREDDDDHGVLRQRQQLNSNRRQNRVQRKIKEIKNKVQDEIKLLQHRKFINRFAEGAAAGATTGRLQYKNDFNRLARVLAGEAVGLVLGGGGARGLSHIGILQAIEEAGIPIDIVGGTSIGSLIGGLYAQDYDLMPLLRKAKQFSVRVSSFWRLLLDLTYPMTAWTTGHAFNRAVWKCLGDSRIEDFWVKYFTNTTNLTLSRMEVHQRGYAWRYIRASMSLAGLLPPIEDKGQMLLDGGYVDNLPVTEMKKLGARYIIAVDVGAVDDTTPLKYGDTLSGVWALFNKWNPFSTTPNVPDIAEIQQRLTYVSSVKALEEAKTAEGVIYLRPPIDNYATLDFARFDEIRGVGFVYGNEELRNRIAQNKLPTIYPRNVLKKGARVRYRRNSF